MDLRQLESNFINFIHPMCGYHICLLCTLAYYGDGKLDQREMDFLMNAADSYTEKNIKDRKLFINEFILMVLDSLKKTLDEVESTENKIDSAKSITELFSCKIYDFFESEDNAYKDDDKNLRKQFYGSCEGIINLNGSKGKNEEDLLYQVRKGLFREFSEGQKFIGYFILAGILVVIYKIFFG